MASDVLRFLREQRHVFFICPCCGEVKRLSDARISYRKKYTDDWLDGLERAEADVELKIERFEEKEGEIRKKAIERARKRILPQLTRRVAPSLSRLKIAPRDVKTILDPIGYVAFDGLNSERGTRRVILLGSPTSSREEKRVQGCVAATVKRGDVGWSTIQIDREGRIETAPADRRSVR